MRALGFASRNPLTCCRFAGMSVNWKFDPAKPCATASLSGPVSCPPYPSAFADTLTKVLFDHVQSMVPDSEF